jgi:PAS domain S-box-containing protein
MRPRPTSHTLPYTEDDHTDAVFGAAPCCMLSVDAAGRITAANPEAEGLLGHPLRPMAGLMLSDLVVDGDQARVRDALASVLTGGVPAAARWHTFTALDPSGNPIPVELALGKLLHDRGPATALAVIHCTRHMTDTALDTRARLEAMLECAPAFIIGLNERNTIDFINRTLPHLSKESVIGSHWLDFFHVDQRAVMEPKLLAMYETGTTQNFETHTPGHDGRPIYFATQIAPIRSGDDVVGAVLVAQDVTEHKRTQAELLANRHLALLGTLAAGVAHEINTPVQFVTDSIEFLHQAAGDLLELLASLQTLRHGAVAGQALAPIVAAADIAEAAADLPYLREHLPQAIDRCRDGLTQISKIVRSLKDFAHPSSEEMAPTDLNRLLENAITMTRNEYKYVATVETDLGDLPAVACHAADINQVVLNILVNAAHAITDKVRGTDAMGVIRVSSRYEPGVAILSISDTGTGIPEAVRARIFDPFFTTKGLGEGTGQGLSIAWSMIKDRHGGQLTLETEVGKGTTFEIRIPNR